jgi:hypothetical protein
LNLAAPAGHWVGIWFKAKWPNLPVPVCKTVFQSNLDELAASAESDKQLSATGSLGNIPLTVVRHGIPDVFASMPAEQAKQAEKVWQELQADLTKLSSHSQMLVAEKKWANQAGE